MRAGIRTGEFLASSTQVFLNAGIVTDFIMNFLIVLNINPSLTKILLLLLVYFWGVQP